jgi:hypothetical protein
MYCNIVVVKLNYKCGTILNSISKFFIDAFPPSVISGKAGAEFNQGFQEVALFIST